MEHHDLPTLLPTVPALCVTRATTDDEAMETLRVLQPFNQCLLGLVRFAGLTPWERHPDGDELLHVLAGRVEVTVLGDGAPERTALAAGAVCVVPRGLWHRQHAPEGVALLFATPTANGETSWADDPR